MTPPPGWYRDPSGPHLERWWDGTAWTDHRRAPEAAAPPVPPPVPPGAPARSASGGNRTGAVALTTAGAVLVAAIVTGAVLLGKDDGDPGARNPPPSAPASSGVAPTDDTPSPSPSASASAAEDPSRVADELNGITLPLLDGWVRPEHVAQDDVVMTRDGTYDCPGDGGVCRHGLVISRTVTANDERSPEALAREDISDAADDAYGRDLLGKRPFGGIESHEEVGAGPVAVAGRAGYFVRWRVRTAEGPGGYVQSLVFPSTVGTESPVLVRYVFDAGPDGPPLADMDRITKGIRPAGDASTGGGVGSSIGPTG
ncbi:DUF2510 domain-containing protein [Streptomyces sp. DH24]|uniref:DUF2510 domain-containing protein n=1 Tax=Streptomyces sp. DH24 TaxID=3040123 RepID=UPI002441D66A|nr:DUF2510 domain-containing protein [Streptomyces sp. DH24]MDG9720565.1 DUF2510 domain-containing protein [Streptomyces sp. DH24]